MKGIRISLVGLAAAAFSRAASAQTDVLYTIGNDGWNNPGTGKMVQGGAVVGNFNTQTPGDSALAVADGHRIVEHVADDR